MRFFKMNYIYFILTLVSLIYFAPLVHAETMNHANKIANINKSEDEKYISGFMKFEGLLAQKNIKALKTECSSCKPEYNTICTLLLYLAQDKKLAQLFLSKTPKTKEGVNWLWQWDAMIARKSDGKTDKFFSSGFAARYIDEIYLLVEEFPEIALERLLLLYQYANGEYAEYLDDKLQLLFKDDPDLLFLQWQKINKFKKNLKVIIDGIDPKEILPLKNSVDNLCHNEQKSQRCKEIRKLFTSP